METPRTLPSHAYFLSFCEEVLPSGVFVGVSNSMFTTFLSLAYPFNLIDKFDFDEKMERSICIETNFT